MHTRYRGGHFWIAGLAAVLLLGVTACGPSETSRGPVTGGGGVSTVNGGGTQNYPAKAPTPTAVITTARSNPSQAMPSWYSGPDVYSFQNRSYQIYIYDWAFQAQNLAGNAEISPRVAGSFSTPACSLQVRDTYLLKSVLEVRSPTFPCGSHVSSGPQWDVPDIQLTHAMVNQVDVVMQQFGWVAAGSGQYKLWWNHIYTRPHS